MNKYASHGDIDEHDDNDEQVFVKYICTNTQRRQALSSYQAFLGAGKGFIFGGGPTRIREHRNDHWSAVK